MASRVRKPEQISLEDLLFSTAEQKLIRLLLNEATTVFPLRQLSNRLKGVRGVGGADGLKQMLSRLAAVGLIDWVDHERSIRLRDDEGRVELLKVISSVCDLETLRQSLEPLCSKGFLLGVRAQGKGTTDSDYELGVISEQREEVLRIARGHPLGRRIQVQFLDPDDYRDELQRCPGYVTLWGSLL